MCEKDDIPHVFYNPMTCAGDDGVTRSFNTAFKKAEIKDFRYYKLVELRGFEPLTF